LFATIICLIFSGMVFAVFCPALENLRRTGRGFDPGFSKQLFVLSPFNVVSHPLKLNRRFQIDPVTEVVTDCAIIDIEMHVSKLEDCGIRRRK